MINSPLNKRWNTLFSGQILKIILGVTFIFWVISLWHNLIYADDSWFGEQAYWFAKCGYPKAVTMKGLLGIDDRLFMYHKLNIALGALVVKLFGWSVYNFKMLTLSIYILFFIIFNNYYQKNKTEKTENHFLLASVFLFVNPMMFSYSFSYRPEILVMTTGFISYYFITEYFKQNKNQFLIFAGAFAGLAFLSHPNGLIFSIAGVLLLFINKKYKGLFIFGFSSLAIAMFFFYDLYQPGHLTTYLYQIQNWPDNVGSNYNAFTLKNVLLKLSQEHKRFFWSYRVMAFSILFLLSVLLFFKQLIQQHKSLLQYVLVLILSLNIFGCQIAERYLIYFFPYFCMIIACAISFAKTENKYAFKLIFIGVFALQLFFTGKMFAEIYPKNADYATIHHEVMNHITDTNALTLVPNEYVFNEIENRNLVVYKAFEYYQKANGKFTQLTFFKRAADLQIQYIVIGKRILTNDDETFPFFTNHPIEQNPYYSVTYRDDETIILRFIGKESNL